MASLSEIPSQGVQEVTTASYLSTIKGHMTRTSLGSWELEVRVRTSAVHRLVLGLQVVDGRNESGTAGGEVITNQERLVVILR
jgi:hypothetical protein